MFDKNGFFKDMIVLLAIMAVLVLFAMGMTSVTSGSCLTCGPDPYPGPSGGGSSHIVQCGDGDWAVWSNGQMFCSPITPTADPYPGQPKSNDPTGDYYATRNAEVAEEFAVQTRVAGQ